MNTTLKYMCPELKSSRAIEFRSFFGATAGFVRGRIFMSCGKFGVALKLPKEFLEVLFKKKDVKHLKYFPNGHIKKEYAVLPSRILKSKRHFQELVDASLHYVSSLHNRAQE